MPVQTLRERAYVYLRGRLASGELSAGTQLSEPTLAKELGMSRTPVREALRQMEMEGLVECVPRYGVVVRMPDRNELGEMFMVREALESCAAAEAARRIGDELLKELADILDQMRGIAAEFGDNGARYLQGELLNRYLTVDMRFHRLVIRAAGNRYMSKILDDTRLLSRIFRSEVWVYDRTTLAESNRFHGRLLEALRQRDGEAARRVTVEAMQVARRNAVERFEEQQTPGEYDPYET